MIRNSKVTLGLAVAILFMAPLLPAQKQKPKQPQPTIEDLRKDIQTLSETVKAMQKDLQDIKAMLTRGAPAAPPQNVVLDLDSDPSQGERTAKLTLVEFTDYQ